MIDEEKEIRKLFEENLREREKGRSIKSRRGDDDGGGEVETLFVT